MIKAFFNFMLAKDDAAKIYSPFDPHAREFVSTHGKPIPHLRMQTVYPATKKLPPNPTPLANNSIFGKDNVSCIRAWLRSNNKENQLPFLIENIDRLTINECEFAEGKNFIGFDVDNVATLNSCQFRPIYPDHNNYLWYSLTAFSDKHHKKIGTLQLKEKSKLWQISSTSGVLFYLSPHSSLEPGATLYCPENARKNRLTIG